MKNKKLKVLDIILISLLIALSLAIIVLYAIKPEWVQSGFEYVVELLNKPLPIIGLTVGAVLFFAWQVIVRTNYGKKIINALMEQLKQIKEEHEQYKIDSEKEKQELKAENQELKGYIADICALSTNKKIKDYGKGLEYGKETNCETTTE